MARKLTEKEFITELANRWSLSYDSAKEKYYELIDFMCDELSMYGFIDLPTFGNFKISLQQGKYIYLPSVLKNGEVEKVWIDPYERVRFKASQYLRDCLNKDKTTKAETLRLRKDIKKQEAINKQKEHEIEVAQNRQLIMATVLEKKAERKKQIDKNNKKKNKHNEIAPINEPSYWDDLKE